MYHLKIYIFVYINVIIVIEHLPILHTILNILKIQVIFVNNYTQIIIEHLQILYTGTGITYTIHITRDFLQNATHPCILYFTHCTLIIYLLYIFASWNISETQKHRRSNHDERTATSARRKLKREATRVSELKTVGSFRGLIVFTVHAHLT